MIILIGKLGKGERCGDFYVFLCRIWRGEHRALKWKILTLINVLAEEQSAEMLHYSSLRAGGENSIKSQQKLIVHKASESGSNINISLNTLLNSEKINTSPGMRRETLTVQETNEENLSFCFPRCLAVLQNNNQSCTFLR